MRNTPSGEVKVRATLNIPSGASGPVPAVIIAHSSDGLNPDVYALVRTLSSAGFATVHYDSFASRGIQTVRTGNGTLAVMLQVTDAFATIKVLATDTRIDPKRIAYAGVSVGGGAAIVASSVSLQRRWLGHEGPRFAAHLAFYPGLHAAPTPDNISEAPTLIILGEKTTTRVWSAPGPGSGSSRLPSRTRRFRTCWYPGACTPSCRKTCQPSTNTAHNPKQHKGRMVEVQGKILIINSVKENHARRFDRTLSSVEISAGPR